MKAKVVRKSESKLILEDHEIARLYIDHDKIVFGISRLLPGQRGPIDPGHVNAYEVWFVVKGNVACYFPDDEVSEELNEEDVILIPPKKRHQLVNIGDSIAIVAWSQAKF